MQTKPLPNMPRARMPAPLHLPEMFRLADAMDSPAQEARLVALAKLAFSVAALSP
jgi:hypothetical protein